MKKVALAVVAVIFFITVLMSCNQNVCPAYVIDNQEQQVKDNG